VFFLYDFVPSHLSSSLCCLRRFFPRISGLSVRPLRPNTSFSVTTNDMPSFFFNSIIHGRKRSRTENLRVRILPLFTPDTYPIVSFMLFFPTLFEIAFLIIIICVLPFFLCEGGVGGLGWVFCGCFFFGVFFFFGFLVLVCLSSFQPFLLDSPLVIVPEGFHWFQPPRRFSDPSLSFSQL